MKNKEVEDLICKMQKCMGMLDYYMPYDEVSTEYFYVFKDRSKRKLLKNFDSANDKVCYLDVLEYNKHYDKFIRKLCYLLAEDTEYSKTEKLQIQENLTSAQVIDRLDGLKKSKNIIKIEGELINDIN